MIPRQTKVEEAQVPGVVPPPCSLKSNLLAVEARERPVKPISSLIVFLFSFFSIIIAMTSLLATYLSLKGWDPFWKEDPSLCSLRGN